MDGKRVLVAWVGHADLLGNARQCGEEEFVRVRSLVKPRYGAEGEKGPIKTLLEHEAFDEVHLLFNDNPALVTRFADWLGCKPKTHKVEIKSPTDYASIFLAANRVLGQIMDETGRQTTRLCIHLSPGSPAMTATWVLLGKSRYPATFFQTFRDTAWETPVPFDLAVDFVPELLRDVDRTLVRLASESPTDVQGFEQIKGKCQAMRLAVGVAKRAALHEVPVVLLGETGTGKGLFAKAIHKASARCAGPFEAISCAAIPRELIESELFGHDANAFTGAAKAKKGAFERADGGTLFLDEIGECPLDMQAKLLHALEPSVTGRPCQLEFHRVGGSPCKCNVRVIVATNRNLSVEVAENRFRRDLYYRLAIIRLKLPPLRERKTDIPLLLAYLVGQINRHLGSNPAYRHKSVSDSTIAFTLRQPWPGNVRQLYNALLQAAVMSDDEEIGPADLAAAIADMPDDTGSHLLEHPLGDGFSLERHLQDIQRSYLMRAMEEAGGVKVRAAKLLGMANWQTLDAQLERLGVKIPSQKLRK